MSKDGISRRQFCSGAAVVAAASVVPVFSSVAPAVATPTAVFPQPTPDWVPLDATAIAREAYEMECGKYPGQSG